MGTFQKTCLQFIKFLKPRDLRNIYVSVYVYNGGGVSNFWNSINLKLYPVLSLFQTSYQKLNILIIVTVITYINDEV